jgi:hypothetical protein
MAKYKAPQNTPPAAPTIRSTPPAAPAGPSAERSEFKGSGTAKPPAAAKAITREQIERRAYDIYASRGYAAGDPAADWHEAERQLRAGL